MCPKLGFQTLLALGFFPGNTVFALAHAVNGNSQTSAQLILGHDLRGIFHAVDAGYVSRNLFHILLDLGFQGFQACGQRDCNADILIGDPLNAAGLDHLSKVILDLFFLVGFQSGFYVRDFALQRFICRAVHVRNAFFVNLVEVLKRLHDLLLHGHAPGIQILAVTVQRRPALLDNFEGFFRAGQRKRLLDGLLSLCFDAVQLLLDDRKLLHHNQTICQRRGLIGSSNFLFHVYLLILCIEKRQ